jgi:hypothetical protein
MSKLKVAGPALLYVVFLLPSSAQFKTASMFAKQVEQDVAALSSQPSVGAWQKLHPDEELELANYDPAKDSEHLDLRLDYDSWCAASISRSPSTFGRFAVFFLPNVRIDALPPLPDKASVRDGCRMQALQYSASIAIPAEDLIREFSSVWGTPDRSRGSSGSQFGHLENIYGDAAIWGHDGVSIRLHFEFAYSQSAGHDVPERMVLYVKRDAVPVAPCFECTSSLMYPLLSEGLTQYLQEAVQIAAEDPALSWQIVGWSRHMQNPQWVVDPTVTRNNLRKWLEVAKQRSPHQRAAALLLADLYVDHTGLGYAAKPDVPYTPPADFYKGLGAEYDKEGETT